MSQIYKHTKSGNLYLLLFIAKETDKAEDVVVYQALYGENQIWVRPMHEFFGAIEFQDDTVARFEKIEIERLPNI